MYNFTDSLIESIEKDLPTNNKQLTEAYTSKYLGKANPEKAKQFYATLKNDKLIDLEAFHEAFDDDIAAAGLLNLFNDKGKLVHGGTYGSMKKAKQAGIAVAKDLINLWVATFKDSLYTKEQADGIKAQRQAYQAKIEAEEKAIQDFASAKQQELDAQIPEIEALLDQDLYNEFKSLVPDPEMSRIVITVEAYRTKGQLMTTSYIKFSGYECFKGTIPDAWRYSYGTVSSTVQACADALNEQLPKYLADLKKYLFLNRRPEIKQLLDKGMNEIYYYDGTYFYTVSKPDKFGSMRFNISILSKAGRKTKYNEVLPEDAELVGTCSFRNLGPSYSGATWQAGEYHYSFSSRLPKELINGFGWYAHDEKSPIGYRDTKLVSRADATRNSWYYTGPEVDSWCMVKYDFDTD